MESARFEIFGCTYSLRLRGVKMILFGQVVRMILNKRFHLLDVFGAYISLKQIFPHLELRSHRVKELLIHTDAIAVEAR